MEHRETSSNISAVLVSDVASFVHLLLLPNASVATEKPCAIM